MTERTRPRPPHETLGDRAFAIRIDAVRPRGLFQALDFEALDPFEMLQQHASLKAQRMALEGEMDQIDQMLKQFDPYIEAAYDFHGGPIPFAIGAEQFEITRNSSVGMKVLDTSRMVAALQASPDFAEAVKTATGFHHGNLMKRIREAFSAANAEREDGGEHRLLDQQNPEDRVIVLGPAIAGLLRATRNESLIWGKPKEVRK